MVRALYLDLTGRPLPAGPACSGRGIVVEHIDMLARLAYRGRTGYPAAPPPPRPAVTEFAWLAKDDLLPFLAMRPRLPNAGRDHGRAKHTADGAEWLPRR